MATLSQARVAGWASRWLTDELTTLARSGNWEGAIAMFQQMGQSNLVHQNVYHYTTIINACGRAGHLDAALATLAHMKEKNVKPNVYTYTALINACSIVGRTDIALRTFAEMRLADVPPNVRTITALVAACSKTGKWERSFKILEEAEELLVAPTVFTYTAAMDGCRRAGVSKPAVELLGKMRSPDNVRPNEVTYNTVLGACAAAKDVPSAQLVYAKMVADGYQPISYTRDLLVGLFKESSLDGEADDLEVRQRQSRMEAYAPDSDPGTAYRAMQDDAYGDEEEATRAAVGSASGKA